MYTKSADGGSAGGLNRNSIEEGLQHIQRFDGRKIGQVEPVIVQDEVQDPDPVPSGKGIERHVLVTDFQQAGQHPTLLRLQELGMVGLPVDELSLHQVEVEPLPKGRHVGKDAQMGEQAQEEDQMEVGQSRLHLLQELDRAVEIGKEGGIGLRLLERTVEHFGQEEGDHALDRMAAQLRDGETEAALAHLLQLPFRLMLHLQLQNRQGHGEGFGEQTLLAPATGDQVGGPSECFRVHIYNIVSVVVGKHMQYDSPCLDPCHTMLN